MEIHLNQISMDDVKSGVSELLGYYSQLSGTKHTDMLGLYSTLFLNTALKSIILGYNKNEVAVKNFKMKNVDSYLQLVEGIYEFDKFYMKDNVFIPVFIRINPILYSVILFVKIRKTNEYKFFKSTHYISITYLNFTDQIYHFLYSYAFKLYNEFFPGNSDHTDWKLTNRIIKSVIRSYEKVFNYNFYKRYFNKDIETIKDFSYLFRSLSRLNVKIRYFDTEQYLSLFEYYYPATHLFLSGLIYDKKLLKNLKKNLSYLGLVHDTHPLLYHYLKYGNLPGTLPEWKYLSKRINTVDYRRLSFLSNDIASFIGVNYYNNESDAFYHTHLAKLESQTLTYQDIIDFFTETFEVFNVPKRSPFLIDDDLISGKRKINSSDRYEVTFKINLFMSQLKNTFALDNSDYLLFDKVHPGQLNFSTESLKAASRYFRRITGTRARYYPLWEKMLNYIVEAISIYSILLELYDSLEIKPHNNVPKEDVETVRKLYEEVGNLIQWLDQERSKLKPTFKSLLEFSKKVHDVDVKFQLLSFKVERLDKKAKLYKPIMPLIDSLKELEPYWISTSEEIEYKGRIYNHCLWSYSSTAENKAVWFFDYKEAVAHVTYHTETGKLSLTQCYSPGNKETAISRKFAKMVNSVLAEANLDQEKLRAEVQEGLKYLHQNSHTKEGRPHEQPLRGLAVPA